MSACCASHARLFSADSLSSFILSRACCSRRRSRSMLMRSSSWMRRCCDCVGERREGGKEGGREGGKMRACRRGNRRAARHAGTLSTAYSHAHFKSTYLNVRIDFIVASSIAARQARLAPIPSRGARGMYTIKKRPGPTKANGVLFVVTRRKMPVSMAGRAQCGAGKGCKGGSVLGMHRGRNENVALLTMADVVLRPSGSGFAPASRHRSAPCLCVSLCL